MVGEEGVHSCMTVLTDCDRVKPRVLGNYKQEEKEN